MTTEQYIHIGKEFGTPLYLIDFELFDLKYTEINKYLSNSYKLFDFEFKISYKKIKGFFSEIKEFLINQKTILEVDSVHQGIYLLSKGFPSKQISILNPQEKDFRIIKYNDFRVSTSDESNFSLYKDLKSYVSINEFFFKIGSLADLSKFVKTKKIGKNQKTIIFDVSDLLLQDTKMLLVDRDDIDFVNLNEPENALLEKSNLLLIENILKFDENEILNFNNKYTPRTLVTKLDSSNLSLQSYCKLCKKSCCFLGKVNLTQDEYIKIRDVTNNHYAIKQDGENYYIDSEKGKPCPFLKDGFICSIQDFKPLECKAWPIYPNEKGNLSASNFADNCPASSLLTEEYIQQAVSLMNSIPQEKRKDFYNLIVVEEQLS